MLRRDVFRTLLALGLAPLAGCGGWVPLYADSATAPTDVSLREINVAPISERLGQKLAWALRESLNPTGIPTPTRYLLRTTLRTVRSDLGVQAFGLGTRGKLDIYADYKLEDPKAGTTPLIATSH